MTQTVLTQCDARGVATLWLARPEKHNAMNAEMIAGLHEAAHRLGADPGVRVVVLRARGQSFCAGGDLDWMRRQMAADRAARISEARALAEMLGALNRLPKPLIGVAEGPAYGGGVGLLSVCDATIGLSGTRFALTEVRLGLIPATIGPYVVARLGPKARQVFFSGRSFDAAEAQCLGLLSHVVEAEGLEAAMEAEIAPYLKAAPGAVAAAKRLSADLGLGVSDADVTASITALADQWETEEARAGIAAFFEKRPAPWTGSGQ